ncbi:nitroreductase family protein [Alkalibacter mobilis]|uniref:nitroreductase family protein n=1 Tax=Alkalibacter mobilis TaxID=2787712 RepID=UPI00189EFCC0|nr:nitroreductase family protein [Alkalibacter mobilis]MBF7096582.1 nitroreductase family protein [Alkalibacter mobilis]
MLENFKRFRSIRKYKNLPVDDELLNKVMSAALISPSSRSNRPWEFIVVKDTEKLKDLSLSKASGSAFIKEAPVAVVIIADPARSDVWVEDCSIAAYNIQVCARSYGLGTCWIQTRLRKTKEGSSSEDRVKDILGIPEKFSVECIITLGHPDEIKIPYTEKDMDFDKIHYDAY